MRATEIAVVFEGYAPGLAGAESMACGAARELAARGHRVALLAQSMAAAAKPGVTVLDWRRVLAGHDRLPWTPRIVHAFDLGKPSPFPSAASFAASHGAAFAVTPASSAAVWPDVAAATATLRAADAVFALTRAEADRLRSHGACADRVLVVGQAADAPLPVDTAVLQERLGLHGRVVLHLGRRERFKGARELLAAAPEVWSAIPDTSFVFAGPTAGAAIPDGPRLRDLGMVDETTKHGLLALCDVLCVPSRADVFPLVFLEAWSLGKPVVSGDFDGAREVVRDGVDGLVVAVEPAAVATALRALLSDSARRVAMGAAGRERVAVELNWRVMTARLEQGYQQALARRRDRGRRR